MEIAARGTRRTSRADLGRSQHATPSSAHAPSGGTPGGPERLELGGPDAGVDPPDLRGPGAAGPGREPSAAADLATGAASGRVSAVRPVAGRAGPGDRPGNGVGADVRDTLVGTVRGGTRTGDFRAPAFAAGRGDFLAPAIAAGRASGDRPVMARHRHAERRDHPVRPFALRPVWHCTTRVSDMTEKSSETSTPSHTHTHRHTPILVFDGRVRRALVDEFETVVLWPF